MAKRRGKKKYTKAARALITQNMWIMLQELKVRTGKSKSQIIREAIELYNDTH